ncbi:MAG: hypothetical protein F4X83_01690 [Chloroflexi bacterium]|nr:hypothetical protein [Chloroflexota bacterium]
MFPFSRITNAGAALGRPGIRDELRVTILFPAFGQTIQDVTKEGVQCNRTSSPSGRTCSDRRTSPP